MNVIRIDRAVDALLIVWVLLLVVVLLLAFRSDRRQK